MGQNLTHRCWQQDAWSKRAELAVRKGDDELAREALRRKQSYQVPVTVAAAQPHGMSRVLQQTAHICAGIQE